LKARYVGLLRTVIVVTGETPEAPKETVAKRETPAKIARALKRHNFLKIKFGLFFTIKSIRGGIY